MLSRVSSCTIFALVFLLVGCSSFSTTAAPSPSSGVSLQGKVHGGQQPIVGAHVYLYEAATTGYGVASHSLLTAASNTTSDGTNYYVTTDATGSFSITNDYLCDAGHQVYLYAIGGSSGSTGTNSAIGLMAVAGQCPTSSPFNLVSSTPFIYVNEVSTVAAAYAMAGYATDPTHVSASNSTLAATGISNAFANAANLVNAATGVAYTATPAQGSTGTVPQAEIDTLANFLAACVNTSSSSSGTCGTLFANALPDGSAGTAPTDTAAAILNIAHHPYVSAAVLSNLCSLQPAVGAPFQPTLPCNGTSPADFTVGINYADSSVNEPSSLAIDATGNAWIANAGATPSVTVLSPRGVPVTGSPVTISAAPSSIAVDTSGDAWLTLSDNKVAKIVGAVETEYSVDTNPNAVAFNASGDVLVATVSGNVDRLNNVTGTSLATYTLPNSGTPNGIAFGTGNNAWVIDSHADKLYKIDSGGTISGPFSSLGLNPLQIAADPSGNLWSADYFGNTSTLTNGSTGTLINSYTAPNPLALAIDGSGNIWFADFDDSAIAETNNSGILLSPYSGNLNPPAANGYQYSIVNSPEGIGVDGSGDVWVASSGSNSVMELIGAATPVVTPTAASLVTPYSAPASKP